MVFRTAFALLLVQFGCTTPLATDDASSAQLKGLLAPIADVLADAAIYQQVDDKASSQMHGFEAWESVLTKDTEQSEITQLVKDEMTRKDGAYGKQVWELTPETQRSMLPSLCASLAGTATSDAIVRLRKRLVKAHQWRVGYLMSGDSLPGMPIKLSSFKGDRVKMEKACRAGCVHHIACRGYTYQPKQGVCYLKTKWGPVKGTTCKRDECWYHGLVDHPTLMQLNLKQAEKAFGLKTRDLVVGNGQEIGAGDTVTMAYVGKLANGTIFDSGKYVFKFRRNMVILGDDIGLQGMRVGGQRSLTIPPYLGYGTQGYPGSIPPNATLFFNVTINNISNEDISSGYKLA